MLVLGGPAERARGTATQPWGRQSRRAEPLAGFEVRGPRAGERGAGRGAREAGRAREASSPMPCRVVGPSSPECAVQETRRLSGLPTPGGLCPGNFFSSGIFKY